jgi:hypothetical protein
MENEKYQDVVLEQLARITQEITETRNELKEFKKETNSRFDKLETDVNIIKEQTAELIEFRTETRVQSEKLNSVIETIDFLKERQINTDEEIFRLKKKIS